MDKHTILPLDILYFESSLHATEILNNHNATFDFFESAFFLSPEYHSVKEAL